METTRPGPPRRRTGRRGRDADDSGKEVTRMSFEKFAQILSIGGVVMVVAAAVLWVFVLPALF